MSDSTVRLTLASCGEHLGALRRLPRTYSAEEYLGALQLAREAGDGETYVVRCLGEAAEDDVVEVGADVHERALTLLAKRGVHDPDYKQLAAALVEVST